MLLYDGERSSVAAHTSCITVVIVGGSDCLRPAAMHSDRWCAAQRAMHALHAPCVQAGKDRTGIIGMLVLSCAGATEAEIVDDYKR